MEEFSFYSEYAEKFSVDDFAAAFVRLEGGIILDFRIAWAMHMDTHGNALIMDTEGGLANGRSGSHVGLHYQCDDPGCTATDKDFCAEEVEKQVGVC